MGLEVVVEGMGMHTASSSRVAFIPTLGEVRVSVGCVGTAVLDLNVVSSAWCTAVAPTGGDFRLATVEHLFAALAGLGLYEGVTVAVDGCEIPILDGGSLAWCDALRKLRLPRTRPKARVARRGVVEVGQSRYEFEPFDGIGLEVALALSDQRLAPEARWDGDEADFCSRIAPARTFALERDIDTILGLGLARHVPPASVVIIRRDVVESAGHPFSSDEPARHKLLDLVGDLFLFGGPPIGRVRAVRPGHTANAIALQRARTEGLLVKHRS
jgi:UDP-3-O-[3-hydroxymyristoyl] N-acetylglucosamine deacetylase